MTTTVKKKSCEKWMWLDLTGFDNRHSDFWVKEFLDEAGFIPDAISILLVSPRFVHEHIGLDHEKVLPPDCCSYIKPRIIKRERQAWTNRQVKGVVDELHRYGIKAYMSIFATLFSIVDGPVKDTEWTEKHPELLCTRKNGKKHSSLNALKRFKDGSFYEDFYVAKLDAVMKDYGFDGLHAADGYSPPSLPIFEGDFSDDMVEQFMRATGVTLPTGIGLMCDGKPDATAKRSAWLWEHRRADWIEFYAARTVQFWRKTISVLKKREKKIVLNNAWTREPFEALYRYGVDYKRIADLGIDGFVPETVSTYVQTHSDCAGSNNPLYDSLATVLMMKAHTPDIPLTGLCGLRDWAENWDNLEHARPMLEREIYSMSNLYFYDGKGALQRSWDGSMFCLSEDVRSWEWQWLKEKWDLGFSFEVKRVHGATLIWSSRAFAAQLSDYLATWRWTAHRLLTALMSRGAPIYAAASVGNLATITGPILILNPHLYPEAELKSIAAYKGGPIILIGGESARFSKTDPDVRFEDVYPPNQLSCRVYGAKVKGDSGIWSDGEEPIHPNPMAVPDELNWQKPLYSRKVSKGFLDACAQAISDCASPIKVFKGGADIKVLALEGEQGVLRLLVGNDAYRSISAEIDMGLPIADAHVVTRFPLMPYGWEGPQIWKGSLFRLEIPPRGMSIVDITLK